MNRPDVANLGFVTIIAKHGSDTMAEKTIKHTSERSNPLRNSHLPQRATGCPNSTYHATTATEAPSKVPLKRCISKSVRQMPEREPHPMRKNDYSDGRSVYAQCKLTARLA
jgi:hypothetical protein